jgi:hypothetical protein
MTENIRVHQNHNENRANNRPQRVRRFTEAEAMLRELAFVLKMTELVRKEIEGDSNARPCDKRMVHA